MWYEGRVQRTAPSRSERVVPRAPRDVIRHRVEWVTGALTMHLP